MGGPPGSPILTPGEPQRAIARPAKVRRMTLLLLCVALAMAGCARLGGGGAKPDGGGASGGSGASPATGKPDEPVEPPIALPDPVPPPGGPKVTRERPDPSVFNARSASVDHFTIGADGRTVVVYWWGGNPDCFGLKQVRVEVHRGTPIVTVFEGTRESARGRACTMEAVLKSAVVVLDAPILADAANADPEAGEAVIFEKTVSVQPVAAVTDARPHAVSGFALSADGLTLSVYYVGGVDDCYALASASARRERAAGPLTVSVREGWIAAEDVACDDIGVPKVVELTLEQPLLLVGAFDSEPDQPAY